MLLKILLSGLFILGLNSSGISAIPDNSIAQVSPYDTSSQDMNALPYTGPQTPAVTSTLPNLPESPIITQNPDESPASNMQLNTDGLGTSIYDAYKVQQPGDF